MSTLAKGNVKWFDAKKGFGFITAPGIEADIFVHFSAIQGEGFKEVREGQGVEFEIKKEAKGLRAVNVVPARLQTKREAVA